MKDVLDYTEEELMSLSVEQLKELQHIAQDRESLFNTQQLVEKTLMNSLYGALSNKYFPLFNQEMAGAITGNGRYFIRNLALYIENKLQSMHKTDKPYVIYSDTDSVYFFIEPFMNMFKEKNPELSINEYVDWADKFEKAVIQPVIAECIENFANQLNAYDVSVIGADREIIADAAVFSEKKKYYARVRDSEGTRYPEDDPYIKVMGLELIKSSTPVWSKKYLKQAIPHILDKDEADLISWINNIKNEYTKTNPNNIATVGSVSRIDYDLGAKGVPIGSRAAIVHNQYIKENNLENKYSPIMPGDKTKRMFLRQPNKFNSNIIAYTNDEFVNEFVEFIDYDKQFEKSFQNPLSLMTNSLNYNLNKQTGSLEDW